MNIVDRYKAWHTNRQMRKYFSNMRQDIGRKLESGRQTKDRWEKQFGWYEGIIRRDQMRSKDVMDSLRLIRDLNPDASMAIWNFLRLANQGHELECEKPSGAQDKKGKEILEDLAKRVGGLYGGGTDQLINVLNLTGYTQGAIAMEVELSEGLNEVVDFHAVDPVTLEWRKNKETEEIELVQKQLDGRYKVMNPEQVFYHPFDPDIGDPYGRSPILPVLQIVFFQVEVLKDLKAVAHNQGHARFDISVTEEAIMNNIPQEIKAKGPQAVRDFVMNYIGEIEKGFKNLKPDDNFFHPDSVQVEMTGGTQGKSMDVTRVIDVINQQVVTSLKQLPILLGRNEGTTETHGTVQWQVYVAGIESIQRGVKRMMERAYNLALRINGRQSVARLTFDKIRTTDRQEEALAAKTETDTLIQQVQQGWLDNDEAANQVVGHDAVAEPQRPQSSPFDMEGRSRSARSPHRHKTKSTRSDDDEDDFVKGTDAEWAKEVSKQTTKAKDDFHKLLQRQKKKYKSRVRKAGKPPVQRMDSNRADEPGDAFETWVKAHVLTDSDEQMELWDEHGRDWIEQAAIEAGQASLLELGSDIDFDSKDENLLRWLEERASSSAEYIQGTNDSEVIRTLWDTAYDGNFTIQKATEALDNAYAFGEARAEVIARTEMLSAAGKGQYYGDEQSGMVIGKIWQAANDESTRSAHADADEQTVKFDEPFIVDGEELEHPRDDSHGASAGNVIQCRCTYRRILEGEENQLP